MHGAGYLAIWSDLTPEDETDWAHWITREHAAERVGVNGFLACRIFRAIGMAVNRYFILYELENDNVVGSPDYLARLNAPTPWSQRIMPRLGNFMRGGGTMVARAGRGEGATMMALRIEALPENAQELAEALVACDGIAAVQIGATDAARTSVPTTEKGMRKNEGFFAGLMLIEALDVVSLQAALLRARAIAPDVLSRASEPEIYQSVFALDARIADFG
jgi:hypothetical protein